MNLFIGMKRIVYEGKESPPSLGVSPGVFLDEQEAVRRCQGGDLTALGVLFELHHQAVMRTAYGIVRDQDMAEDVVQQRQSVDAFHEKSLHEADARGQSRDHLPICVKVSRPTGNSMAGWKEDAQCCRLE